MNGPLVPVGSVSHTAQSGAHSLPMLIADAGDAAGWRFIDFFHGQHPQPEYAAHVFAGVHPLLCLVR